MFFHGDWPAARGHAERAARILQDSDPDWFTAYPPQALGILDIAEGRWEDGARHMAQSLAVAELHEDLQLQRQVNWSLAERDLMQGRAEHARARLEPLLDRPGLEEQDVTLLLPPLASAYLELGDVDQAERTVMRGLERSSRESNQVVLVDLLRVQGVLRSIQGREKEAMQAFAEAVRRARSMSYPYAEARALYEWGRMRGAKGESAAARELLEEALTIFQRLGANPFTDRTNQTLAGLE